MNDERDHLMDTGTDALPTLGPQACRSLLASQYVGRLGYIDGDRPVIVPVNYRVDDDGRILVLSRPGTKLDVAATGSKLCLQVDGVDDLRHGGWSVLATGTAEVIDTPEAHVVAEAGRLRPWAPSVPGMKLLRIVPDRLEGRQLR